MRQQMKSTVADPKVRVLMQLVYDWFWRHCNPQAAWVRAAVGLAPKPDAAMAPWIAGAMGACEFGGGE